MAPSLARVPPHARGSTNRGQMQNITPQGVPPHARGSTLLSLDQARCAHGSPTREGIHRDHPGRLYQRPGFPHIRGDAPRQSALHVLLRRVPPHTRGCSFRGSPAPAARDGSPTSQTAVWYRSGSPTYEGIHRGGVGRGNLPTGFPHTRGDPPALPDVNHGSVLVPPHARGSTLPGVSSTSGPSGSPTREGIHLWHLTAPVSLRRFPHTRGDPPGRRFLVYELLEVPPHARESTWPPVPSLRAARGSPTREGIHPRHGAPTASTGRFPHTRGDPPPPAPASPTPWSVPPHARESTPITSQQRAP